MCIVGDDEESRFLWGGGVFGRGASTTRTALVLLCDVVDAVVVGIKKAVLWRYESGVRGVHAQRSAAGVGAERKPFSLNEPQFVTLDHDSALVDNDGAGVIGDRKSVV